MGLTFEQKNKFLKDLVFEFKMKRRPALKWDHTPYGYRKHYPENLDNQFAISGYQTSLKVFWDTIDNDIKEKQK